MSAARPALPSRLTWPSRHDAGLIATAGAALLLCQYLAVRELSATVFSTELVAILATLVTLVGPSLGYALGPRLGRRLRYLLGGAALAMQLTLSFGPRLLCGALASQLPTTGLALFALLAAAALLLPCAL